MHVSEVMCARNPALAWAMAEANARRLMTHAAWDVQGNRKHSRKIRRLLRRDRKQRPFSWFGNIAPVSAPSLTMARLREILAVELGRTIM